MLLGNSFLARKKKQIMQLPVSKGLILSFTGFFFLQIFLNYGKIH